MRRTGPRHSGNTKTTSHRLGDSTRTRAERRVDPHSESEAGLWPGPTRLAEALGLGVALESPVAVQAANVANSPRPGIDGARERWVRPAGGHGGHHEVLRGAASCAPASEILTFRVHHLSALQDDVREHDRLEANWADRRRRGHGSPISGKERFLPCGTGPGDGRRPTAGSPSDGVS
jgi:hypothetical protein